MPPAEYNTDPVSSQTYGAPQLPTTGIGSSKVENVAEHQDYVAFLRSGIKKMMMHNVKYLEIHILVSKEVLAHNSLVTQSLYSVHNYSVVLKSQ